MRALTIAIVCLAASQAVAQQNDPASRVYEQASKSVFLIIIRSAAGEAIARGSGFLIADNKIVTNQHVVREGNPFLDLGAVKLPLRVEKVDSINDLAILTVDGELNFTLLIGPSPDSYHVRDEVVDHRHDDYWLGIRIRSGGHRSLRSVCGSVSASASCGRAPALWRRACPQTC